MSKSLPVIALIDMDCFFVQVEQRGKPELAGKPCAVTQYNLYKQGGIIAVNYEARAFGVKKGSWGEDALQVCKDLTLFHTPQRRGKADSSKYREASFEVFDVLTTYDSNLVVEKASIDEAYIDLTEYIEKNPNLEMANKEEMLDCYVEGVQNDENIRDFDKFYDMVNLNPELYQDEINLLKGAYLVSILRRTILEKTQFQCSAGISHSKVLAKLAAGLHKPKSQTILPNCGKKQVLARTPVNKLRSLGGKFGLQVMERLSIQFVDQINNFTIEQLGALFDQKTAEYLMRMANGFDDDKVVSRKLSKSIGCAKNFSQAGTNCLTAQDQVQHWIDQLIDELLERLERDKELNNRRPTLLVVGVDQVNVGMLSRSTQFEYYGKERTVEIIMSRILNPILFKKENKSSTPIRMLSVAATKFTDLVDHKNTIESFFKKMQSASNEKRTLNEQTANVSDEISINQRSRTEFKNLNCKKMMDEYFRELEADIMRPRETAKPKLTILNMFTKIAERTGQDLKTRKDEVIDEQAASNTETTTTKVVKSNSTKPSNPIIDLINKNNQRLKKPAVQQPLITLDEDSTSASNQQSQSSYAAEQIALIRQQGLLDECELKKLEAELMSEVRPRVEKVGFFRRKTIQLTEKRRKLRK